jgi:hypothetical protein
LYLLHNIDHNRLDLLIEQGAEIGGRQYKLEEMSINQIRRALDKKISSADVDKKYYTVPNGLLDTFASQASAALQLIEQTNQLIALTEPVSNERGPLADNLVTAKDHVAGILAGVKRLINTNGY